jgi:predicted TIM-barrel fold metal-dependent hydrolase
MKVFEAHLHLDHRNGVSARAAADALLREMNVCDVDHAVVLHLLTQPWTVTEVADVLRDEERLIGFINVDPLSPTALVDLGRAKTLGFRGLKLHPRQQRFRPDDPVNVELVRAAGKLRMPVLIDCFPDGDWLAAGLSVLQYAALARAVPETTVIVAHAAGHHCIDLMMLAKRTPNLWFDISYSLLYYRGSPVVPSLFYCMKSMRYQRVLFGTDYPDRPLVESVKASLDLFDEFGLQGEERERILWKNAHELLLPS